MSQDASNMGAQSTAEKTVMNVLLALSLSHLLNDTIQSLIPAIYPVLKDSFRLSYAQIGLITFVFQMTGSVLQPLVGNYTDRRPKPYSLALGMGVTLIGLDAGSHLSGLQRIVENDAALDDIESDTDTDTEIDAGKDASNLENNS